jgi:hypothetical protein
MRLSPAAANSHRAFRSDISDAPVAAIKSLRVPIKSRICNRRKGLLKSKFAPQFFRIKRRSQRGRAAAPAALQIYDSSAAFESEVR